MEQIFHFLAGLVTIIVYFIPWFIASYNNHPRKHAIAALNLLLGWTFIGWAGALWWSCKLEKKRPTDSQVLENLRKDS
ncbi:MAG: superinfection immunity protein [Desulfobacteraceae bacterium]|nr:superinfection immunity protein [Desulfobacteraceae bacterium]